MAAGNAASKILWGFATGSPFSKYQRPLRKERPMNTVEEIERHLQNSKYTSHFHAISALPHYPKLTDGVFGLMEMAEAQWLMQEIANYQSIEEKLDPHFQIWTLKVDLEEQTAVLTGSNKAELIVAREYMNIKFPLKEIMFYLIDGVILLPLEHQHGIVR
jgi:hypothetical protein